MSKAAKPLVEKIWAFSLTMSFIIFLFILCTAQSVVGSLVGRGRIDFFTGQSLSILNGHFSVPEGLLGGECFYVPWDTTSGMCEGYFGIGPSLFRAPILWFLSQFHLVNTTDWSLIRPELAINVALSTSIHILSWAAAYLIYIISLYFIASIVLRNSDVQISTARAFVIIPIASLALTTPLWMLASRPMMYEEAILWSVALTCLAVFAAMKLVENLNFFYLIIFLAAEIGVGLSRISSLPAVVFLGIWIFLNQVGKWHMITRIKSKIILYGLIVSTALAGIIPIAINQLKFHSFGVPLEYHAQVGSDPLKMGIYGSGIFNLEVLPTKINEFFGLQPAVDQLLSHPGSIRNHVIQALWPASLLGIEGNESSSFLIWASTTLAFFLVGAPYLILNVRFKNPRWLAIAACLSVGAIPIFLFPGFAFRYMADLLPAMGFSVIFGVVWLIQRKHHVSLKWTLTIIILVLCAFQVLTSSIAMKDFMCTAGGERTNICRSTQASPDALVP